MRCRNLILGLSSIFVCCSYLLSIIGINVHIDHHNNEVFVVSLIEGTSCEDIHPHDHCHCFEHHSNGCNADDKDCENEVDVLSLTGTPLTAHIDLAAQYCIISNYIFVPQAISEFSYGEINSFAPTPPTPELSQLCVLRI